VIAVVRRGPAEVKFDKKEMEYVIANLSQRALDDEIARVASIMQAVGQDPAAARANILEALPKAQPTNSASRFRFEFLASPTQILGDEDKYVTGLEVEDNILVSTNGDTKAKGTGNKRVVPVETVIFAIGDKVDTTFGLPLTGYEYSKNPEPRFPIDGNSYEAYDHEKRSVIKDVFVAGWSRQASTGLVGVARKDGTNGAKAVLQYLQTLQPVEVDPAPLEAKLRALGKPVVTATDTKNLRELEDQEAKKRGIESYKFGTNEEMLAKIMSVG
jgi:ferredoxin--NADP+ reductase